MKSKIFAFTPREFGLLKSYLEKSKYSAFAGVYNFNKIQPDREILFQWHLDQLIAKCKKSRAGDKMWIRFSFPELLTVKVIFKRVDCCKEMILVQEKFYERKKKETVFGFA